MQFPIRYTPASSETYCAVFRAVKVPVEARIISEKRKVFELGFLMVAFVSGAVSELRWRLIGKFELVTLLGKIAVNLYDTFALKVYYILCLFKYFFWYNIFEWFLYQFERSIKCIKVY